MYRRFKLPLALLTAVMLIVAMAVPAGAQWLATDGQSAGSGSSSDYVWVTFSEPSVSAALAPAHGRKIDFSSPAANDKANKVTAQQQNYIKWLAKQYPQVQVVTSYDVTVNALGLKLNGATLAQVKGGPGTTDAGVSQEYSAAMNQSPGLINAPAVWTALGGQPKAGAGIKVGVIDTGIDQTHPFLQPYDGQAYPAGYPKGDTRFTSKKVIVARVYNENPFATAEAVQSHGTHVSGTIGGKPGTDAPLASGLSGVAPGVWLGNYNIFPGHVENAKDLFITKAVEQAVIDGMDVLNLSIGGGAHQGKCLTNMAVDGATDAGVVVVVAAGNEGPGYYTVGSPGTADKVITAAAITNSHKFEGQVVSSALPEPAAATTGDGGGKLTAVTTGTYAVWADVAPAGDELAGSPIPGTPFAGKIVLIKRGAVTFSTKINNAYAAGAVGVIIYNSTSADPIPMSTPGVSIPAVMVSLAAGNTLAANTGDHSVTLKPAFEQPYAPYMLADFTSWGPTPNYTLKPDVAAPGVNVYSSVVGGGYEVYDGTSMATPHVAGSAALLLAYSQANGLGWGPSEVKAALMGTARDGADSSDPLKLGAGVVDLSRAINPPALAIPSSLSFELVRPVGNHTYSLTFSLTNSTAGEQTYSFSEAAGYLGFDQSSVTLAPGASAAVTATVLYRGLQLPAQGGTQRLVRGYVVASSGAGSIKVPYLYVIDYNR
ncbi:MAG: S8 family serine peptidase [Symbiobacteriia bacterium]